MSRFSIVLPVRNGGEYVKECVQGILRQTLQDFNIVVLDNCSTDGTLEWLNSLNDPRIAIYPSTKSLTIEENWSRIREVPRNEYMTMIGHDDVLLPNYLQEMDLLIKKHPGATLYQAHFDYINDKGAPVRTCLPMDEMQYCHEFLACQFMRTIDSTGTGYMMRSADFDVLGGMPATYPNLIYADFELWIKLMLRAYKATTQSTCFQYRLHESVSKVTNGMLYQEAFSRYIEFLIGVRNADARCGRVMDRYGSQFLLYYCESLSHRLLKTPKKYRSITVRDFIKKCERYAEKFIPGQSFRPLENWRTRIAQQLDSNEMGRTAFNIFKSIVK